MRRPVPAFIGIFLLLASAVASAAELPPPIPAQAYLLMDAASGQVLTEYRGNTRLPIASTTKIMTAVLAIERGNFPERVTVGQKPYDTGGSTIYLDLGETQTLENLLYALLLESANDAAVAIAEHLAGTEERFVDWMNQKAREIGAHDTHFTNSHGLHHDDHYSTAYDLALIARYAMLNQAFRKIILVEEKEIPGFKANPPRKLSSKNRLLGYYDGVTGVKNGYTEQAGLTNVASASRGGMELIAVVLGAENRLWTSSMALMDFGFANFRSQVMVRKGEFVGALPGSPSIPAVASDDAVVVQPPGAASPERQLVWDTGVSVPVQAGARLGQLRFVSGGKTLATADVAAASSVPDAPVLTAGPDVQVQPSVGLYQQGFLFLAAAMLLSALSFFMRRRHYVKSRRPTDTSPTKPRGRERLYEIRNRRK